MGLQTTFSVFVGRSGLDKVFDAGVRYRFLRQMEDGSMPVSVAFTASTGLNSSEYNFLGSTDFSLYDRTSYYAGLPVSRKFSDSVSLQLTPMMARFNRTGFEISIPSDARWYYGIGLSGRYRITGRLALTGQFIWSENDLGDAVRNNVALGLDIETGGHVFQLFFTTTQALNDAYVLAGRNGNPLDGGLPFRVQCKPGYLCCIVKFLSHACSRCGNIRYLVVTPTFSNYVPCDFLLLCCCSCL